MCSAIKNIPDLINLMVPMRIFQENSALRFSANGPLWRFSEASRISRGVQDFHHTPTQTVPPNSLSASPISLELPQSQSYPTRVLP